MYPYYKPSWAKAYATTCARGYPSPSVIAITAPRTRQDDWSYNGYFAMPFKARAQVTLRNDTAQDTMSYAYVESEPLSRWEDDLGYFHATWRRKAFQLTKDTRETFFRVEGAGHVLGRQLSVATDEPLFKDFGFVMEGNNEVDIDGRERSLDYLGTEDSFTFSWGFQRTFAGLRAGMTHVSRDGARSLLSIYRFHDHLPIRFQKGLSWSIDWRHESFFTARPEWTRAVEAGGCWVDFAAVFYWYQSAPGGYRHEPLPAIEERRAAIGRPRESEKAGAGEPGPGAKPR